MVQIITDSSTLFTVEEGQKMGIEVLPLEDAKKAVAMIKERFADVEVQLLELGAAFVTQGGPRCVAIQYIEK